ncbi:MAG: mechanosensitive ion channel [Holophagae bacterium]
MEAFQQVTDAAAGFIAANYRHALAAAVILALGWLVAGWARRLTRLAMTRGEVDAALVPFITKLVYYALLAVTVVAALNRLGVATTSVVAIFGAVGLALGLALQGTLSNFASGVMLLIFRPFDLGDFVEAGGTTGVVLEIGVFSTTLRTPDNVKIVVPNKQIYDTTISNYQGFDTRRIDLVMGIAYDDDIKTALSAIREIVTGDERVLADPEPQIAVSNLGDSSVDIVVRPWCATADYWDLRFDLTHRLKEGLEAAGCSIPFPQRDVHVHRHDADDDQAFVS